MLCRYIYNIYRVPASRRAVLAGFVTAVVGTTWVAGGAQLYRGQLRHVSVSSPPQPSSTQLCPASWNVTAVTEDTAADSVADTAPPPGYLGLYEVELETKGRGDFTITESLQCLLLVKCGY